MENSCWLQLRLLLILQLALAGQATLLTVHWNSSNPLFKPTGENVLTVQLTDRLLFVCPTPGVEFYRIKWTTSADLWRRCTGGTQLFSCRQMDSFLVDVRSYSADPTAPTFNDPVYFYTPSTGDPLGIDQKKGGACLSRNMRLKVVVAEQDTGGKTAATAASPKGSHKFPSQQSTVNNGMFLASRPSPDKEHRRYQQQLNLITGSSATAGNAALVSSLSLCAALLRGLLIGLA